MSVLNNLRRFNLTWNVSKVIISKSFCSSKKNSVKSDFKKIIHEQNLSTSNVRNSDENEKINTTKILNYDEMFREISQGDPEVEKRLKVLEMEMTLLESQQHPVPSKMIVSHWKYLLTLNNLCDREKYFSFLHQNEVKDRYRDQKQMERQLLMYEEDREAIQKNRIRYHLDSNSLFDKFLQKSLIWLYTEKLIRAKMYSQRVVFDCSYEPFMTELNKKVTAHQLVNSFVCNRKHAAPFHVQLCNVPPKSGCIKYFNSFFYSSSKSNFIWDIHEESFLELYPKTKLVYLTPDSNENLKTFNHDDIYIIGAFVDTGNVMKMSLGKAKQAKIRTAKLPLDLYLKWERGGKSLQLNIVLSVLLDLRLYQDWNVAFKNIPSFYLTSSKKE